MTAATAAASAATSTRGRGLVARFLDGQRRRAVGWHDLPARTALRAANVLPVRRLLAARYRAAVARHRATLSALAPPDAAIVAALHRDGVFVTTLDELALPGSAGVLAAATRMAGVFAGEARARVRAGADFVVAPPAMLLAEPALFAWGLGDWLLAIAETYLEQPVAYDGVCLNYTVADGREVSTRRWHRDWEDRRMLKVAVYLNDVDAQGGPFQMVKRTDADRMEADGYRYELASDDRMAALFGDDFRRDIVSCEGRAGTVVFTDTARFFHRGKPAVARDRAALFYSYFARRPRHPFLCERSGLSRRDIAALSQGLTPRQQAASAWRGQLPLLVRLIPSARI